MLSSLISIAWIALLSLGPVLAAPTSAPLIPRSFKVHRVKNQNHVKNGTAAMMKSCSKWGIPLPQGLTHDLSVGTTAAGTTSLVASTSKGSGQGSGQVGEVSNVPVQNDSEFVSPVNIGGQNIMMDFDTGSSDLWVLSTKLPANQIAGRTSYNPDASSTFQLLQGESFSISFGDKSSASGVVGTDTVNIGGATVTSQAVECATQVSNSFLKDTASNGLVGLAFSKINTVQPTQQTTFFDSVSSSLAQPVLSANLKHSSPGFYEFGAIDNTQFKGTLAFTPIDLSSGFWQFASSTFAVGNGAVQQNTQNNPAIADTGTSLLLVDPSVIQGYWSQVNGAIFDHLQGGIVFPCTAALPDLHLALGPSYMATISGTLMNFAQINSTTCFGAMQSNSGQGVQILGDIMFKSQFVVFDNGHNAIGFAPHT